VAGIKIITPKISTRGRRKVRFLLPEGTPSSEKGKRELKRKEESLSAERTLPKRRKTTLKKKVGTDGNV